MPSGRKAGPRPVIVRSPSDELRFQIRSQRARDGVTVQTLAREAGMTPKDLIFFLNDLVCLTPETTDALHATLAARTPPDDAGGRR